MTTPTGQQPSPKRPPTHPLKTVMDAGRHPWVWAELGAAEAEILAGLLDVFVHYYNAESVSDRAEVIPGCWRGHPRLMHELPVLYWQWWSAHHHPAAELSHAGIYYAKVLPDFQDRLDSLIGMGGAMCRKGEHSSAAENHEIGVVRATADHILTQQASDRRFIEHAVNAFRI